MSVPLNVDDNMVKHVEHEETKISNPWTPLLFTNPFVKNQNRTTQDVSNVSDSNSCLTSCSSFNHSEQDNENISSKMNTSYVPILLHLKQVKTLTGEENDEVLYEEQAALYRLDGSEWKERGSGTVKLLKYKKIEKLNTDVGSQAKINHPIRLLMRQSATLKCCMNHNVGKEFEFKPCTWTDFAWTWTCEDYACVSTGESQSFTLQFETSEQSERFKKVVSEFTRADFSATKIGIESTDPFHSLHMMEAMKSLELVNIDSTK
ncbi:MAG: hypothetical protein Sylvanvirus16_20 [Sylvanvirus sp.]|uniref:RanBD1 domain-containing protein n=1 Tax=Sylvanvirus sp. TaxID=2487774 RepID=A0A3G5ALV2_9VIRU|nr:MAG: hypothetical protein Sylvanvirus16_20 [Sylvanvirus sp.]